MNVDQASLRPHHTPRSDITPVWQLTFGLLGGPAAWFIQLCGGFSLSTWPCFPGEQRLPAPALAWAWTRPATAIMTLLAFAIALAAMRVSGRLLREASAANSGGSLSATARSPGRTCFLALWGTVAGGAFAVAITFTGIALFILPRCAG